MKTKETFYIVGGAGAAVALTVGLLGCAEQAASPDPSASKTSGTPSTTIETTTPQEEDAYTQLTAAQESNEERLINEIGQRFLLLGKIVRNIRIGDSSMILESTSQATSHMQALLTLAEQGGYEDLENAIRIIYPDGAIFYSASSSERETPDSVLAALLGWANMTHAYLQNRENSGNNLTPEEAEVFRDFAIMYPTFAKSLGVQEFDPYNKGADIATIVYPYLQLEE